MSTIVLASLADARTRAQDARRKVDLETIRKAVVGFAIDNNLPFSLQNSGCGIGGNGKGWFDGAYPPFPSVKSCLVDGGYLNPAVSDPQRNIPWIGADASRYMVFPCQDGLLLMANLKSTPSPAPNAQACTRYDTGYGMDYFLLVR